MNFDQSRPFEENPYKNRTLEQLAILMAEPQNISPKARKAILERVVEIFDESSPEHRNKFLESYIPKDSLIWAEELDVDCDQAIVKLQEAGATAIIKPDSLDKFYELHKSLKEQIQKAKLAIQQKPDSVEGIPEYKENACSELEKLEKIRQELLAIVINKESFNESSSNFFETVSKFLDFCRKNGLDVKYKAEFDRIVLLKDRLEGSRSSDSLEEQKRKAEELKQFVVMFYTKLLTSGDRSEEKLFAEFIDSQDQRPQESKYKKYDYDETFKSADEYILSSKSIMGIDKKFPKEFERYVTAINSLRILVGVFNGIVDKKSKTQKDFDDLKNLKSNIENAWHEVKMSFGELDIAQKSRSSGPISIDSFSEELQETLYKEISYDEHVESGDDWILSYRKLGLDKKFGVKFERFVSINNSLRKLVQLFNVARDKNQKTTSDFVTLKKLHSEIEALFKEIDVVFEEITTKDSSANEKPSHPKEIRNEPKERIDEPKKLDTEQRPPERESETIIPVSKKPATEDSWFGPNYEFEHVVKRPPEKETKIKSEPENKKVDSSPEPVLESMLDSIATKVAHMIEIDPNSFSYEISRFNLEKKQLEKIFSSKKVLAAITRQAISCIKADSRFFKYSMFIKELKLIGIEQSLLLTKEDVLAEIAKRAISCIKGSSELSSYSIFSNDLDLIGVKQSLLLTREDVREAIRNKAKSLDPYLLSQYIQSWKGFGVDITKI